MFALRKQSEKKSKPLPMSLLTVISQLGCDMPLSIASPSVVTLKQKRQTDRPFLDTFSSRRCIVCHRQGCDPCHVRSRGAGGGDEEFNVMPLCRRHHQEQHAVGIFTFAGRHGSVLNWLLAHGWEVARGKVTRPRS